jgi:hypothetical protein
MLSFYSFSGRFMALPAQPARITNPARPGTAGV